MFERETVLFRFVIDYYTRQLEGLEDAHLELVPAQGLKPAVWILGHLAIANDYTLGLLGQPTVCDRSWHASFGPGSIPLQGVRPSKDELQHRFREGANRVLEALPGADQAAMSAPHSLEMEFLKSFTPTVGDLVAHLVTTHPAVHLGQLSITRRSLGLPDVLS
jgi:hypothetical protein